MLHPTDYAPNNAGIMGTGLPFTIGSVLLGIKDLKL